MAKKLWLRMAAAGGDTPVYLTKEPTVEGSDESVNGFYETEKNFIEVESGLTGQIQKETLFHEIIHRCFSTASGDLQAKILGHSSREKRWDHEELIVSFLAPVLYDILVRNGWLRIPDPPKRGRKRPDGGNVDACKLPGNRKKTRRSATRSRRTRRSAS